MTSVELCSNCHASIALTSYKFSFETDFARAYKNPTQSEASCIEKSLGDPSVDMAALAQEIKRVESTLDALKAHHAHLNSHIQRSIQYMRSSSIRRLPTEVLGIIFASACTSFQRSEYKTPLSISLVCPKWRDIALATPSLWTHIYVAPDSDGLDVYQHYLERCGNIPISIKIEIPYKRPASDECSGNFPDEETDGYDTELVLAIYRSCAQWKVAELWMNEVHTLHLRYPRQREFPLLESLTLVNKGPLRFVQHDLFHAAPLLTSFTLLDGEGKTVSFDAYRNALPWRQLREVGTQADTHSLRQLRDEFQDGSNRTLVLRPHRYDRHLRLGTVPFSLLISALVLDSVIWTSSLSEFFRIITMPTLQSLTMMSPYPNSTTTRYYKPAEWIDPFSVLPEFLASSGCALQTFAVIMRGRYINDIEEDGAVDEALFYIDAGELTLGDSLVAALHNMKDLRALRVIEAEVGPSLFNERLFQEMTEGRLLPELTSLELVWAEDHQPVDTLIPMLTSRAGQGGAGMDPLSSVVLGIRNGGALRSDVQECMANLRRQGIKATLW